MALNQTDVESVKRWTPGYVFNGLLQGCVCRGHKHGSRVFSLELRAGPELGQLTTTGVFLHGHSQST